MCPVIEAFKATKRSTQPQNQPHSSLAFTPSFSPQNLISPSPSITESSTFGHHTGRKHKKTRHAETPALALGSSHQTHRRHEIYLTHLPIGHTRLTHAHLLSNLHPLSCDYCDTDDDTPLSVNHMFSCPSLAKLRQSLRISSPNSPT